MAFSFLSGAFRNAVTVVSPAISKHLTSQTLLAPELIPALTSTQVRNKFVNCRQRRDAKRRVMVKEAAPHRLRLNAMRRNTILPKELQDLATEELLAFPLDTNFSRIHNRCIMTARGRGLVQRWRLSRIQFRLLADYNKLSGVTRALW